jgi:hypothetical protein
MTQTKTSETERYPEGADLSTVEILRTDAIDAAGALVIAARHWRRMARSKRYAGASNAGARAGFREMAELSEAAAKRVQRAADDAVSYIGRMP